MVGNAWIVRNGAIIVSEFITSGSLSQKAGPDPTLSLCYSLKISSQNTCQKNIYTCWRGSLSRHWSFASKVYLSLEHKAYLKAQLEHYKGRREINMLLHFKTSCN